LLFLHLALSPLVFSRSTADVFEENKVAWLALTAILLLGLGASACVVGEVAIRVRADGWKRLLGIPWRDPVFFAVVLYVASAIVSTSHSLSPHTSWRGAADSAAGLWTILGYAVLFLATRAVCRGLADGRQLLWAVVIGAAVSSLYATLQVLHRDPLEWDGLSAFAGYVRPFATLAHPNSLGAYLVLAIPLLVALTIQAAQQRRWVLVVVTVLIVLLATGIVVLTLSRAAWLGGVCSFVVLLMGLGLARAWRAGAILAAGPLLSVFVALGAFLTLPAAQKEQVRATLTQRVQHLSDGAGRWSIWRAAWEIFREHPLTGAGLDTFRLAFGAKRPVDFWQQEGDASPTKAHNEFLHTLATQGLLGGVALLLLIAGCGLALRRSWRQAAPEERSLLAAIAASMAGFAVTCLFGFTVVGCSTLFLTCAALLSGWSTMTDRPLSLNLVPARSATLGQRLLQLGILGATAAGLLVGVVQPYQASVACYEGDRLVRTQPRAALAAYERAVSLDPGYDRYWSKLSGAAQLAARAVLSPDEQKHKIARAKQALEQAAALVPADPYHHANLARFFGELAYRRQVDPAPSLREWEAALAADPRNATFLSEAARTAVALGDLKRVRSLVSRGLSLYPRCGALQAQLGACALASGCLSEAAATFTEAVQGEWGTDNEGPLRALTSLSTVYLGLHQYDKALSSAGEAIRREPEWAAAHYLAAQAFEKLGNLAEARKEYHYTLKNSPGHAGATAALERLEAQ
jgi:O-antigen ligase/tetratricopeptide (TPR) repeat protein